MHYSMNKLILTKDFTPSFPKHLLTMLSICMVVCFLFPINAYSHKNIPSLGQDNCTFQIDPQHQTFYCLEKFSAENVSQPLIYSSCGPIQSTAFQDEYLDLGCSSNGFTGYFMTPNWQSSKIKGDGGVDVTGAPNSILVEGANNALVSVVAGSLVQHSIVIPAEGYLTFDWSYIGGSNLFSSTFSLLINDQIIPLANAATTSGNHFSELLQAGDQVSFKLNNLNGKENLTFKVEGFQFLTNAIGVTRRKWTAVDAMGNNTNFTQLITFERATLTDVIFPNDWDGLKGPFLNQKSSSLPANTGYPVIDKDGNPNTTADQYYLNESDCAFEVKWIDDQYQDGSNQLIHRQWIITDWCSGSIMEETQIIKIAGTPNTKGVPNDYYSTDPRPKSMDQPVSEMETVSQSSNEHFEQHVTHNLGNTTVGYSKSASTQLTNTSETQYHPLTDEDN